MLRRCSGRGARDARGHRVEERGRRRDVLRRMVDVERGAEAVAAIVDAEGGHAHLDGVLVERRVAVAVGAVEAHAPFLEGAEAAADIEMRADLRVAVVARGDAGERLVVGALGDEVDGAADAAGAAAEERGRAEQHLHALQALREAAAGVGEVEQPVEGGVEVGHREAADEVRVALAVGRRVVAHGRVVLDDVGDGARLLVADQLLRVARHAERRLQDRAVAERPEPGAGRDLTADVRDGRLPHGARLRRLSLERSPLPRDVQFVERHRVGGPRAELDVARVHQSDGGGPTARKVRPVPSRRRLRASRGWNAPATPFVVRRSVSSVA